MNNIALQLETVINAVLPQLQAQELSYWNQRETPHKWSKKEILGHLTDSAFNNLQRFVRATYAENFKLIYDQDEWVKAQNYKEAELEELIYLWYLTNKQIVRVLQSFPKERKEILIDVGKPGPDFLTVEFLANDYITHMTHHLKQMGLGNKVIA